MPKEFFHQWQLNSGLHLSNNHLENIINIFHIKYLYILKQHSNKVFMRCGKCAP